MKFPEIAYFLPALKDQRTQRLEYVTRNAGLASALFGENVAQLITVPNDRFFCLTGWGVRIQPAGAAYMESAAVYSIRDGVQLNYWDGKQHIQPVGSITQYLGSSCEFWFAPGTVIGIAVTLAAAGAVGSSCSIQGVQIPRGNFVVA